MSKIASEVRFGKLSTYKYGSTGTYNQTRLGLGPTMVQLSGNNSEDNWAGPLPVGLVRPMEYSTAVAVAYPWAMRWSDDIDWVFFADNATALATRRILKATYDRRDASFSIDGFVTLNFPNNTAATVRGMRMTYDLYTTGTVAAQSRSVTGNGTDFLSGISSGCRIGFGTSTPSLVNEWGEVSGSATNTAMTLVNFITGSYPTGTPYVVEDLRALTITTNITAAAGGLFVTKGLRPEIFSPAGTAIASGSAVDNLRATYQIIDANTVLNTAALGGALEEKTNNLNQNIYILDGTSNPFLYKYNVRAPLTLTSGRATNPFILRTAQPGALVGVASQANNGRMANTNHGPGAGLNCIYFTTTSRLYRTNDVSTIASGSTTWIADNAVEIPPGGANTFAASSVMNSIEYSAAIDRFIVPVNAVTTPFRSYVTRYVTDSSQFDRIFGCDIRQLDQSTADSSITPVPGIVGGPYSIWSEGGISYIATIGTTAAINKVYAIPLGGDWEYASTTKARIVSPEIMTPDNSKFIRAYLNDVEVIGGKDGKNLGMATEPFRIYFRTAGINDDSGSWTLLNDYSDLSGVAAAPSIQFMFEFRTIGVLGVPARLLSLAVLYEDLSTLSNYQPSVANSSITSKRFAWRFATAFGSTVPTLRIRLYDAVSNGLLVNDTTVAPAGTFQKSTDDGLNWTVYNTTDKANETTYIRYIPLSLGDNIKVSAVLTLN